VFLTWLRAVETTIHPKLEAAEQQVVETMK
jgi:hypothetical protein